MAPRAFRALALTRRARVSACERALSPIFTQTRGIAQSYLAKVDAAKEDWAKRAEDIEAGRKQHVWDTFTERGFLKDVAG